jgi:hypothetical protein
MSKLRLNRHKEDDTDPGVQSNWFANGSNTKWFRSTGPHNSCEGINTPNNGRSLNGSKVYTTMCKYGLERSAIIDAGYDWYETSSFFFVAGWLDDVGTLFVWNEYRSANVP